MINLDGLRDKIDINKLEKELSKIKRNDFMKEQVEIKNTTTIQLQSLDAYMSELGYKRTIDGLRYEFIYPVKTGERFISLRSAVNLHNTEWAYDEATKLYYPIFYPYGVKFAGTQAPNVDSVFKLSPYEYEKSQARKIIEYVHIQKTNNGRIVTQSHQVKFRCAFYFEQFLED